MVRLHPDRSVEVTTSAQSALEPTLLSLSLPSTGCALAQSSLNLTSAAIGLRADSARTQRRTDSRPC